MACRRLPLVFGNVRETELSAIYCGNPDLLRLRQTPLPDACGTCRYAASCAGGAKCIAYARTGRYDLPDPDCPFL